MKVGRVGPFARERPVAVDVDGTAYDLSADLADIDGAFLASGGLARLGGDISAGRYQPLALDGVRIGAPVARPGKIVCIGLNYVDHAVETGAEPPAEPVIFMKAANTVVGPHDPVLIPRGSTKTDWEVELAVVIGQRASYLETEDDAAAVIAGYTISNDVSEREFQLERGGQWSKGKSCETFNPLGPWLVPSTEIADVQSLGLRLSVNGTPRQAGTTANMIFSVQHIVWYLSQFMVLDPGDVINTGTPAGVAIGFPDPKPYLRDGDVVELAIDGLGRQRQQFTSASAARI
jgi:2-keto-4-pentenoate hydratase/2-oxohepta-3-ene-1,7-dioic acid hydratase in catechol pathway